MPTCATEDAGPEESDGVSIVTSGVCSSKAMLWCYEKAQVKSVRQRKYHMIHLYVESEDKTNKTELDSQIQRTNSLLTDGRWVGGLDVNREEIKKCKLVVAK